MNKQRLQRVLDNMEAQGLDQILVTSTASVFYLTGYWIEPHERMLALYIDKNGRTALYGNEIFGVEATADLPVIPHADSADPVADLAAALAPGRLGVDKFWPSKFLIGIMEHRPDIRPVLGSGPIDAARRYKDEAERDALRRASKINDIVVETAIGALADGAVEAELAALVNRTYLAKWGGRVRRAAAGLLRRQRRRPAPRPRTRRGQVRRLRGFRHFHPHPAVLVRHDPHRLF